MQRLDTRIQEVFDGPKWSIPARVYARPLELYAGLNLDQSTVVEELERLSYTQITTGNLQPGQYKADASGVYLYTRGFSFADGFEAAIPLALSWQDRQVQSLISTNGQDIALARLEPQVIGRISPANTEDRLLINLEQLPEGLTQALLAVEDPKFFEHHGVSVRGIPVSYTHLTLPTICSV